MHKYVFLESEVTNFFDLNDESQFIYLCCVKTDDHFHVLDTFEEYIKPEKALSKYIEEITKITNPMLAKCRHEKEVLIDFLNFLGDATIISYNAPFEMKFLAKGFYKRNIKDYKISYFDIFQEIKRQKIMKTEIPTLENVAEKLNITHESDVDKQIIIMKKLLANDNCNSISEFINKDIDRIESFKGLSTRKVRMFVDYNKNNRRLTTFIDLSKNREVCYYVNIKRIDREPISLDELLAYKNKGAIVVEHFMTITKETIKYIDFGIIYSNTKDIPFIKKRNYMATLDYLIKHNKKIILIGSIEEFKKNYRDFEEKFINKIILNCIKEESYHGL